MGILCRVRLEGRGVGMVVFVGSFMLMWYLMVCSLSCVFR